MQEVSKKAVIREMDATELEVFANALHSHCHGQHEKLTQQEHTELAYAASEYLSLTGERLQLKSFFNQHQIKTNEWTKQQLDAADSNSITGTANR